jgi:prolyl-tRNA editing enzyme YbaK/EbsC (Cys-tRNA(Pro) deacylase)
MSIERARAHLRKYNLEERIQEFEVSSATVELAAKALNIEGARIAKSLSYLVDGGAVLVVAAGDIRVDNRKFKDTFHTKAKMLTPEQATEMIGHAVGGVCPFGVNEGVKVYLDESLKRFETVYPAAGSSNSAVELSIPELEQASECTGWVDVAKEVEA